MFRAHIELKQTDFVSGDHNVQFFAKYKGVEIGSVIWMYHGTRTWLP